MKSVKIHDHTFKIKIPAAEIQKAISSIASKINSDYSEKKPLFIAVLNGSFMFASDLMKKISIESEITFVKVASYEGTSSTGDVKSLIGVNEDISGRSVIIIEDIVDTGNTVEHILKQLKGLGVADVKIATLLFKPEAFTKKFPVDYVAISVPNDFLVGFGLDYDGLGRNLEDIYVIDN